ncbi:MAG: neutral zinc metallopeptidase [Verrucomicrobia bacterium]|nr:neutral zinc metallopeptidase [Verrucomicrobiota bacterium]
MKWEGRRESSNVEDRRRVSMPVVGGGIGLVVVAVLTFLLGGDPTALLQQAVGPNAGLEESAGTIATNDPLSRFVAVVLADTEDVWNQLFARMGRSYEEPKLVLFSERVSSACGMASAATGPFYCPGDYKVYIDLRFYEQLQKRFGAPGDFAQAYVIAHEVGHHVQKLLGIMEKVDGARGRVSEEEMNRLSVRLELQADFFAGVWAHHTQKAKQVLETGDLEEALNAASAIGDDNIQKQSQGYVVPDSFTHGTSQQRVRWFRRGFETGDLNQGDTFTLSESQL